MKIVCKIDSGGERGKKNLIETMKQLALKKKNEIFQKEFEKIS